MTRANKLSEKINQYGNALKVLAESDPLPSARDVLAVLNTRDELQEFVRERGAYDTSPVFSQLIDLDVRLKSQAHQIVQVIKLTDWRASLNPSEHAWWWYLDKYVVERKERGDYLWEIFTGTLLTLSLSLALEIVKRFWASTPDTISVWGTLFTILFTASPFIKQGREVANRILDRLPVIKNKYKAKTMAIMSGFILLTLLSVRLWLLPGPLTIYYNNAGVIARNTGNLALARQLFERAASFNPDRAVPYHNLADAYLESGLEQDAEDLYRRAVEQDANFVPAYNGLGELYNQQGEYAKAETILLAGLSVRLDDVDEKTQQVLHYTLLSNLGWSYWGQNKMELAKLTLEDVLAMETDIKTLGDASGAEYRLATAHFYLAQLYENIGQIALAQEQWEYCLRLLDQSNWRQRERYLIAQDHLSEIGIP